MHINFQIRCEFMYDYNRTNFAVSMTPADSISPWTNGGYSSWTMLKYVRIRTGDIKIYIDIPNQNTEYVWTEGT